MASSRLDIVNGALAEVPAELVATVDENSLQGRWTRQAYPKAKEFLLAMPIRGWSFARGREALAAVTNDRDTQWGYAYQIPAGKVPVRLFPSQSGTAYVPVVGQALSPVGSLSDTALPFEIAGSVLYTNVADALMDYRLIDVSEAAFSPLFVRALELEVAARIVLPITKDRLRKRELEAQAKDARDRAMADDLNREPQRYAEYVPDSILARS